MPICKSSNFIWPFSICDFNHIWTAIFQWQTRLCFGFESKSCLVKQHQQTISLSFAHNVFNLSHRFIFIWQIIREHVNMSPFRFDVVRICVPYRSVYMCIRFYHVISFRSCTTIERCNAASRQDFNWICVIFHFPCLLSWLPARYCLTDCLAAT